MFDCECLSALILDVKLQGPLAKIKIPVSLNADHSVKIIVFILSLGNETCALKTPPTERQGGEGDICCIMTVKK